MELFEAVLLTIWIVWWSLPFLAGLTGYLLKFWTRGRVDKSWATDFQKIKYEKIWDEPYWDEMDNMGTWVLLDFLCFGATCLLAGTAWFHAGPMALVGAAALVCMIFGPRYIMDIAHSIRYNFKTKDSDRLAKLEAEIRKIKGE